MDVRLGLAQERTQTKDGEKKKRCNKKSGVNYIMGIIICTPHPIQGLFIKFSD
jgi:hypothetical protein